MELAREFSPQTSRASAAKRDGDRRRFIFFVNRDDMYMLDSGQKERFFFTRKEHKSSKGEKSISKRTVSDKLGLWKSKNHHPKPVENSVGKVIGQKRKLVYHRGRYNDSQKTDWIMEEYSLVNESTPRKEDKGTKLDKWKWVICRVYRESTSKKSKKEEPPNLENDHQAGKEEEPSKDNDHDQEGCEKN